MSRSQTAEDLLRQGVLQIRQLRGALKKAEAASTQPIAILAMSCRAPGNVVDPEGYWQLLVEGGDGVGPFPDRWDTYAIYDPNPGVAGKSSAREGGFLRDVDEFDAGFFGLSPREAELIDPQHRMLLELSYSALEDAGYDYRSIPVPVGFFGGVGISSYLIYNLWPRRREILGSVSPLELLYANDKDYAATRISYLLNLRGPSMSIGTASTPRRRNWTCRSTCTAAADALPPAGP